jgi:DNA-binding transcriptional MocR family regulator
MKFIVQVTDEAEDDLKHRLASQTLPAQSVPSIQPRGALPDRPLLWPSAGSHQFDDGLPDQRLIPIDTIAQSYASAARTAQRRGLLSYGDPRGTTALREAVSRMLNLDRSLTTTEDNICVTRGSQMALYVVAHALVAPGDSASTYFFASMFRCKKSTINAPISAAWVSRAKCPVSNI